MTENEYHEFTFDVPLLVVQPKVVVQKEGEQIPINLSDQKKSEVRRAIALVGDRFYKGEFLPATELEKAAPLWKGTLHDINHMGVRYMNGFLPQSNILYFVGWQDGAEYDADTKSVSMNIHPNYNTYYGKAWKAYVELTEEAGGIANVSVSFLGQKKLVKVKDLPEGVDYKAYGYSKDDMVLYIYNIQPSGLSTVLRGVCNDKAGCGITNNSFEEVTTTNNTSGEKDQESKQDAEKRAYLDKRLKRIKGGK